MKVQIAARAGDEKILRVAICEGSKHDFALFKDSGLLLPEDVKIIADKGYQVIDKLHENVEIPVKASKKRKLTAEERKYNSEVSKKRIFIEHVNRHLKIFRILSSKYRNKRKRFGLRLSLICGIYNFQL